MTNCPTVNNHKGSLLYLEELPSLPKQMVLSLPWQCPHMTLVHRSLLFRLFQEDMEDTFARQPDVSPIYTTDFEKATSNGNLITYLLKIKK